jgi:ComF family protein
LKFEGRLAVAGSLAEALLVALGDREWPDLLMPVPLHGSRLVERGFNQSTEIARRLARAAGVELAPPGLCRRVRPTASQSELAGVLARRRNVAGAFQITGRLRGRDVAIVDDVMTTGATVGSLAREAQRMGARTVEVWVACRALPRLASGPSFPEACASVQRPW